jgi:hypothetical protein
MSESDWITLTIDATGEAERTLKSTIGTYGPLNHPGKRYVYRLGARVHVKESVESLRAELEKQALDWITLTIESGEQQRSLKSEIGAYGPQDGKGKPYIYRMGARIHVRESVAHLREELEGDITVAKAGEI